MGFMKGEREHLGFQFQLVLAGFSTEKSPLKADINFQCTAVGWHENSITPNVQCLSIQKLPFFSYPLVNYI